MKGKLTMFLDSSDEILCMTGTRQVGSDGYPVMLSCEDVRIFGSVEDFFRLSRAITAYLLSYAPEANDRPIPAEASTGAVVDTDELFESLADTGYFPRPLTGPEAMAARQDDWAFYRAQQDQQGGRDVP